MIYDYVQNFAEKLGVIDRISQRIVKEETGMLICSHCSPYSNGTN